MDSIGTDETEASAEVRPNKGDLGSRGLASWFKVRKDLGALTLGFWPVGQLVMVVSSAFLLSWHFFGHGSPSWLRPANVPNGLRALLLVGRILQLRILGVRSSTCLRMPIKTAPSRLAKRSQQEDAGKAAVLEHV